MNATALAQAHADWQAIEVATQEVRAAIDRLLAAQLAHQRTRGIDPLVAIGVACDQTATDVQAVLTQQTMAFQFAAAEGVLAR